MSCCDHGPDAVDDRQVRTIVAASIRQAHSLWTGADRLPGIPANHARRIRQKWRRQIEAAVDYTFQNLPIDPTPRNRLIDIACRVFTANLFPDNVSGVVVAGFGEEDYLPGVASFDMEGVLLSFVKARQNAEKSAAIDARNPAAIIPFAQGEMVGLFLEGIDPAFRKELEHALDGFVAELADALVISAAANRASRKCSAQAARSGPGHDVEAVLRPPGLLQHAVPRSAGRLSRGQPA
jgi:hypothetical protein